jgi:hypothetical protein
MPKSDLALGMVDSLNFGSVLLHLAAPNWGRGFGASPLIVSYTIETLQIVNKVDTSSLYKLAGAATVESQ